LIVERSEHLPFSDGATYKETHREVDPRLAYIHVGDEFLVSMLTAIADIFGDDAFFTLSFGYKDSWCIQGPAEREL
jgi:hypothetical protein